MADNVTIEVEERVEEYVVEIQESVVTVDSTVTETSSNPVKSSGIWTWVTGLFTTHTTEADAHPATAITVDETPVADYTPAEQGDNMQDITNKVRGLQDVGFKKIAEIEITDPIAFVDITQDLEGKDLDLKVGFDCSFSLYSDVDGIDYGNGIQVNNITGEFYRYTTTARNWLIFGSSRYGSSGQQNLRLNGGHPSSVWTFNVNYGSSLPGTIFTSNRSMVILQDILNIEKIRVLTDGLTAGSKIVIYGA